MSKRPTSGFSYPLVAKDQWAADFYNVVQLYNKTLCRNNFDNWSVYIGLRRRYDEIWHGFHEGDFTNSKICFKLTARCVVEWTNTIIY